MRTSLFALSSNPLILSFQTLNKGDLGNITGELFELIERRSVIKTGSAQQT